MTSFIANHESPCGRYTLTVEVDNKVAYAYLKQDDEIVGDVWLFNRCVAPQRTEWRDRNNLPFANCEGYMSERGHLTTPVHAGDIKVKWEYEAGAPWAYVYVFEELFGVIGVGDKPGYARFAIKDGPLARVMEIDDSA